MKLTLALIALTLSGCASLMPASAKAVQETRTTVAELAQETAAGSAVAAKARAQAAEGVGLIPPSVANSIESHLLGAVGASFPLLGTLLVQMVRARRREEAAKLREEKLALERARERERRLAELDPAKAREELQRETP